MSAPGMASGPIRQERGSGMWHAAPARITIEARSTRRTSAAPSATARRGAVVRGRSRQRDPPAPDGPESDFFRDASRWLTVLPPFLPSGLIRFVQARRPRSDLRIAIDLAGLRGETRPRSGDR